MRDYSVCAEEKIVWSWSTTGHSTHNIQSILGLQTLSVDDVFEGEDLANTSSETIKKKNIKLAHYSTSSAPTWSLAIHYCDKYDNMTNTLVFFFFLSITFLVEMILRIST